MVCCKGEIVFARDAAGIFVVISQALYAEYGRLSLARLETCASPCLLTVALHGQLLEIFAAATRPPKFRFNHVNDTTRAQCTLLAMGTRPHKLDIHWCHRKASIRCCDLFEWQLQQD